MRSRYGDPDRPVSLLEDAELESAFLFIGAAVEKGFRKSKYRDEPVPTRPCKKCSTEINGLDYAGDYCGMCSAIARGAYRFHSRV